MSTTTLDWPRERRCAARALFSVFAGLVLLTVSAWGWECATRGHVMGVRETARWCQTWAVVSRSLVEWYAMVWLFDVDPKEWARQQTE